MQPQDLLRGYDSQNLHIGIFGSHSAVCLGVSAKLAGMKTVLVAEEGREKLYLDHNKHLYDEVLLLQKFADVASEENVAKLRKLNTIFIPNRSFSVYVGYAAIEQKFNVPLYGNRSLLRAEERDEKVNQYAIMDRANITRPKQFLRPSEIDRPVIVKAYRHKKDHKERAYFQVSSYEEFKKERDKRIAKGILRKADIATAPIEEFVEGINVNANFHVYGLKDRFGNYDFVGTSDRKQTGPFREEVGHFPLTIRESLKPLFFDAVDSLNFVLPRTHPPGLIGPLGVQGCIRGNPETSALEYVVFDLSFRVPGDLIMGRTSPEMRNLSLKHSREIEDPMDLIIMEIEEASKTNRLAEIVT
jgi:5-formaminoimidazole-4-carboxamide-1-(beta)-D-ribofuranosyl 5'-monophosphate synthetase